MLNANQSKFVDSDAQLKEIEVQKRELEKERKKLQSEKLNIIDGYVKTQEMK